MTGRPRRRPGVLLTAAAACVTVLVPIASSQAAAASGPHPGAEDGGDRRQVGSSRPSRGSTTAIRHCARRPRLLSSRADGWLGQGPWTVVDKPKPAPSGDIARLSEPGALLVALPAQDARESLGLPVRPARRRAQSRGRHRHRPPRHRQGRELGDHAEPRLVLHRQEAVRRARVDDPAHLVRGPGDPDEPQSEPRAVHPLQVRRPGDRHHRLLAAVHQRPGRHRDPRHRGARLVEERPGRRCGRGTPPSWTGW